MSPELKTPPHRRLVHTGTPGIYRRGHRYVAVTYDRGKRIKTTHDTKAEACRARVRRCLRPSAAGRERFEDYVERWLVEYRGRTSRGLAPSTRDAYASTMRTHVVPYFRGRRIGDIGRADVKRFIDHLATLSSRNSRDPTTRLAGSTIRKILTPLKAMFAEAYELEIIPTDAGRVRVIVDDRSTAERRPKTLSRAQIAALDAQLDPRDRLLILLLRWTGLRISEALGLRWEDLDRAEDGPVLHVRRQWQDGRLVECAKTPAGIRSVAIVPSLERALEAARRAATFDRPRDPIFATRRGTHQDSHNLRRRLRPAAHTAGVPWMTPHVLRHSLATELLDNGHDINAVANVLGHRSTAFTRRTYIHARATPRFDDLDAEEKR